MATRANVARRRSRNAKSLSVHQTQDCDSESETAVTSTSGQKVATLPTAKRGRPKKASRSPGMSRSRGASRSPGVSKSPAVAESDVVSVSPVVLKSPALSKSLQATCSPEASSKSPVAQKSPVALKSEQDEATDLRVASKATGVSKQPSPSKKRRCQATVVKEEPVAEEKPVIEEGDAVGNRSTEDQSPGCQRLLMREWLLREVELNNIPGLGWLDRDRRLIRIPWIHASKDGWSKDSHCKLFENWAIYTGKYDAGKQKPDHKRWKANFRCALNSLGDIKEEPDMSKKNGTDGYRVYRVEDAVDRKGHRRHKMLNYTPAVESPTHSSVRYSSEISCKQEEQKHQLEQPLEPCRTSPNPMTSNSSAYMQEFTDSMGQPILILPPSGVIIACSAEFIRDTVCPGDGSYTSLSNMTVVNDDGLEFAVAMDNQETVTSVETVSSGRNCASERDIVSLRNLDHNYFSILPSHVFGTALEVQIPTTVENFVDDDNGASSAEPHPKMQRPEPHPKMQRPEPFPKMQRTEQIPKTQRTEQDPKTQPTEQHAKRKRKSTLR